MLVALQLATRLMMAGHCIISNTREEADTRLQHQTSKRCETCECLILNFQSLLQPLIRFASGIVLHFAQLLMMRILPKAVRLEEKNANCSNVLKSVCERIE